MPPSGAEKARGFIIIQSSTIQSPSFLVQNELHDVTCNRKDFSEVDCMKQSHLVKSFIGTGGQPGCFDLLLLREQGWLLM